MDMRSLAEQERKIRDSESGKDRDHVLKALSNTPSQPIMLLDEEEEEEAPPLPIMRRKKPEKSGILRTDPDRDERAQQKDKTNNKSVVRLSEIEDIEVDEEDRKREHENRKQLKLLNRKDKKTNSNSKNTKNYDIMSIDDVVAPNQPGTVHLTLEKRKKPSLSGSNKFRFGDIITLSLSRFSLCIYTHAPFTSPP